MLKERRNILAAITEIRQVNPYHVEAMKEVLPKTIIAHQCLKVLVSGRDNSHIGLQRLMPSYAVVLSVREHP